METLINMIAFFLIFMATDVGRGEESRVEIFSLNYLIQLTLIIIAGLILSRHN